MYEAKYCMRSIVPTMTFNFFFSPRDVYSKTVWGVFLYNNAVKGMLRYGTRPFREYIIKAAQLRHMIPFIVEEPSKKWMQVETLYLLHFCLTFIAL